MPALRSLVDFFVYSRPAIEIAPLHDVPHVIISITSSIDDVARIKGGPQCLEIVRLTFLDVDALPADGGGRVFDASDARAIWGALFRHRAVLQRVVAHCDAGLSRSPAVVAAIAKARTGDDADWFRRYHPNHRVYRTMLETYFDEFESRFDHD